MKKKLLIISPHMIRGGVERSLINVSNTLKEYYDVSIMLIKGVGDMMDELPKELYKGEIPLNDTSREEAYRSYGKRIAVKRDLCTGHFISAYKRLTSKDPYVYLKNGWNDIEELPGEYDIAICFHMHHSFLIGYIAEKVRAKKKVLWVRSDLNTTGFEIEKYKDYIEKYQMILCISQKLYSEVIQHLPCCESKTFVIHNFVDSRIINKKARESQSDTFTQDGGFKILTVGRLENEKGIDIAIRMASLLKENGILFQWIVVGDGSEKSNLIKMIEEHQLGDKFRLLGNKSNPYSYMNECELYVQPSRHEGWCNTVTEALFLNKIVISTDFAGAREQIVDGMNGIIIEQGDETALYQAIHRIIQDKSFRNRMQKSICESVIVSDDVNKLIGLLER